VPAVVTLEDAKMAKEDEIVTLCREHIANYKLSHQVAFFDALALSGASMIMKSVLRDSYRKIQKR
jgi:acyl-CoA synthetase (AMP-forming)/AMP-acid ligase II